MPSLDAIAGHSVPLTSLPFPPVTKQHILDCSYESWYRTTTLRSRIIPLTSAFLEYLREDGLWLPDDIPYEETPWSAQNENKLDDPDWETDARPNDASAFADVHQQIQDTIEELGGSVVPKLNWSAPKDALHMALSKNSMECRSANDIYLLLKSSIFVTHDLEHAFDDCIDLPSSTPLTSSSIPYNLILRPFFKIDTAFEFRCFVKDRTLIGISQRDLKYVGYSAELLQKLQLAIQTFFGQKLKNTFVDPSFAFDVYLPDPYDRVRLIDINPWASRTDPLLFSWLELLNTQVPGPYLGVPESDTTPAIPPTSSDEDTEDDAAERNEVEELPFNPDFRIVQKDDPEAYNFGTAPYSAHKLPKELVDAGLAGGGAMKELMEQWNQLLRGETLDGQEDDSDDYEEDEPTPNGHN